MNDKRYIAEWQKENTKIIPVRLNLDGDKDIIQKLDEKENKSGYIKNLKYIVIICKTIKGMQYRLHNSLSLMFRIILETIFMEAILCGITAAIIKTEKANWQENQHLIPILISIYMNIFIFVRE